MLSKGWRKSTFSGPNSDMCVEVLDLEGGDRSIRHSKDRAGPVLTFSAAEWTAFLSGVRAGEFD